MQKCNEDIHKEHRNPQADALRRPLDNAHTKSMKSRQSRRRTSTQCTNFKNSVVLAEQCAELNNINCVLSYTSITGPPFSSCERMELSSPYWFASKRCVPMVRKIKSAAATRLCGWTFRPTPQQSTCPRCGVLHRQVLRLTGCSAQRVGGTVPVLANVRQLFGAG